MLINLFREIRAIWRLARVSVLVLRGIIMVRFCFPYWDEAKRRAVKQAWAGTLVEKVLGVRIEGSGLVPPDAALIVCNHISWLDVFVINAITPTTFVCKDDVKSWPAIGWLVEHTGTLFIERGNRAAASRSAQAMAERMAGNERVAVFPEGTTTQGTSILPFRAALFQAAIDAKVPVQPASLRYRNASGETSIEPAYDGDISFGQSMLTIARASGLRAEICFLDPVLPTQNRRDLALLSEAAIASDLNLSCHRGANSSDSEERPFVEIRQPLTP